MVHYCCPSCRIPLESQDDEAGLKVACPTCGQRMRVPRRISPTAPHGHDESDFPRPRRTYDYDKEGDVEAVQPVRRRHRECPHCGEAEGTYERKDIAQEGWVVLVILAVFFWPLFWIGLLMKQNFLICRACGFKICKLDGVTFG